MIFRERFGIVIIVCLFVQIGVFCKSCMPHSQKFSQSIEKADSMELKHSNHLANETSPYLLQHASNPVDWYPWGEEALEKAKRENKLLLISIGYSACHWCHVMEHESFEDEDVAKIMNEHFVSIKIDREERPDIDQVYMNAVQLLNQRGGWPLNCFALPDGKPFFGGTYFPKKQWVEILGKIQQEYIMNPEKVNEFANRLTKGVQQSELIVLSKDSSEFKAKDVDDLIEKWSNYFDNKEGGADRAPKFPIPNNYLFLLQYAHLMNDNIVLDHVQLTLDKMAYGGIYDQIGGGFARYSTDALWKVPHFEKMLYDNAQLVSLYSEAYKKFKNPLYKEIVYQTIDFIERELMSPEYVFYSALDADSEGEEGKYYVWEEPELKEVLGDEYAMFSDYYNINQKGLWEGKYILLRDKSNLEIAEKYNIEIKELENKIILWKQHLLGIRSKRIRPGLDDKCLTSWNGLMLKGYLDAYNAFGDDRFLKVAEKNASFIVGTIMEQDGRLLHSYKNGIKRINGYLEDYAFCIEGLVAMYEATFDHKWLDIAKKTMDYSISHFYDKNSGMFYFTSDLDPNLIARKMEITDNVIPASNSSIAKSLFSLGTILYNKQYVEMSKQMLLNVRMNMVKYPSGYSNWASLMMNFTGAFYEIAIVGDDALNLRQEFNFHYIPNKLTIGSVRKSKLPLLENKFVQGSSMIYICIEKSCKLPVANIEEALKQIN